MSGMGGASPAEQHLGDRLAALVDGELGHDARERVLAHLATCGKCKAEADAQRRLKSVFAETAPPGPSEGLLARLQGLPGGDPDGPGSRLGSGGFGPGDYVRGGGPFGYVPPGDQGGHAGSAMAGVPVQPRPRGFRVHEAERPGAQRRRLAFAAAGAVSLAAFALSGALPLEAVVDTPGGRGEGTGTAVTPLTASPAAGDGSKVYVNDFLASSGARTGPLAGGPAATPQVMGPYAPGAAVPPRSAPAVLNPPAGRFGLSPLIAATGPAPGYRFAPVAAEAGQNPTGQHLPALPPLEPKRPLAGSAAPSGQGAAPAPH
ncbi:zf-HC2 domain-containing protein [Streptomyces piniterrae]|uniref:Zf-HC2 domain-containing protein n=1 Tax=Streptomyces piniterrae TaxID=2571125 RepID=A0A4U0MVZ3_9ACTN|nr:zf-HC2 domain-containing protein [Streptomyces piniterrae]TJZ45259.1 zf-HC2 domain-containing protein [Streptomyces piniterrae]